MEPTRYCPKCEKIKQYCAEDINSHDQLQCKLCLEIHAYMCCYFGHDKEECSKNTWDYCNLDSSICECKCQC